MTARSNVRLCIALASYGASTALMVLATHFSKLSLTAKWIEATSMEPVIARLISLVSSLAMFLPLLLLAGCLSSSQVWYVILQEVRRIGIMPRDKAQQWLTLWLAVWVVALGVLAWIYQLLVSNVYMGILLSQVSAGGAYFPFPVPEFIVPELISAIAMVLGSLLLFAVGSDAIDGHQ